MTRTIGKFFAVTTLALAVACVGQLSAFASGDEPAAPTTKAACEKAGGKWDAAAKTCSGMKQSMLDEKDQQLYDQGHDQAMAGQYQQALATFGAISNQDDPMVLTMTGYAERKLGHVDVATALYFKALAVDPNNVDTHEYLGEGYVASGRLDLAKAELATVQDLCGNTTCEQYEDLSDAIASNPS
jgi:Flp pilus assembly protein TadD